MINGPQRLSDKESYYEICRVSVIVPAPSASNDRIEACGELPSKIVDGINCRLVLRVSVERMIRRT